jgi:hypothetical protein
MHYNYLHKLPNAGYNFYRLKMIDKNGQFTYSPVIKININLTATKVAVLQNPVSSFLNLRVLALKNETLVLNLYSADGKIVASRSFSVTKGNNQLSWNLQLFAAGNYFISSADKSIETIRLFKN